MKPKKIKVLDKKELLIEWDDNSKTVINLKLLRDECPCASCKGETILFKTIRPPSITVKNDNMYIVTGIQLVGGYAVQITWKDGHSTGIYTYDYLKTLGTEGDTGKEHNYKPLI